MLQSDGRTRNEEPLVNASIDRSRRNVLSWWDLGELRWVDAIWRGGVCDIGQADVAALLLASNQAFPGIAALADDLLGVLLVLAFTAERELVLGLAIWDLVDTEPFVGSSEQARKVTLHILNVVQLGSKGIVDLLSACQRVVDTVTCSRNSHR